MHVNMMTIQTTRICIHLYADLLLEVFQKVGPPTIKQPIELTMK